MSAQCAQCGGDDDQEGNLLLKIVVAAQGERVWLHAKCWDPWLAEQREAFSRNFSSRGNPSRDEAAARSPGEDGQSRPSSLTPSSSRLSRGGPRLDCRRGGVGYRDPSVFTSQLDWALFYALALGLAVLPADSRKHPIAKLAPHGFKSATRDAAILTEWWQAYPHAEPAIAIPLDMVVADADESGGQHGVTDFERLAGCRISDIETPQAQTRTGGVHALFAAQGHSYGNHRIRGTAVDVRGGGLGYLVAPGHHNGRFWLKPPWATPLRPAPAWMDEALKREPLTLAPRTVLERAAVSASLSSDPWSRKKALLALERACARIVAAPCGEQRSTLNRESFTIGGLIGRDDLDYTEGCDALVAAARQMPAYREPWHNLEEMVAHALEDGMARPLPVSDVELFMRNLRARMRAQRPPK
jgi:hypothetical protein